MEGSAGIITIDGAIVEAPLANGAGIGTHAPDILQKCARVLYHRHRRAPERMVRAFLQKILWKYYERWNQGSGSGVHKGRMSGCERDTTSRPTGVKRGQVYKRCRFEKARSLMVSRPAHVALAGASYVSPRSSG
ncbi:hypothetical protein KC345_g324 [Hortaea werneckii]|nr:hypothetical protein KC345_g324 [Hortaea werneckii]